MVVSHILAATTRVIHHLTQCHSDTIKLAEQGHKPRPQEIMYCRRWTVCLEAPHHSVLENICYVDAILPNAFSMGLGSEAGLYAEGHWTAPFVMDIKLKL